MERTCQEKGRRARAKKNASCISTRKETERKRENQVERLVKVMWKSLGLKEDELESGRMIFIIISIHIYTTIRPVCK